MAGNFPGGNFLFFFYFFGREENGTKEMSSENTSRRDLYRRGFFLLLFPPSEGNFPGETTQDRFSWQRSFMVENCPKEIFENEKN